MVTREELAKKAAEAQFEGDTDTLFLVQSQAQEAIVKAKEAEWYKNRPELQPVQEMDQKMIRSCEGIQFIKILRKK